MRDIRFRGKDILYKKWHFGSLASDILENIYYIIDVNYGSCVVVDEDTIGKFTGLKDKNGKEIYEGDILKFSEVDTAVVEWNEQYAYFMAKPIEAYYFDSDVLGHTLEYNDNVEVIGNISDTPYLLK